MKTYRKKPVEIQAVQFTGENADEIMSFVGQNCQVYKPTGDVSPIMYIHTLEGVMSAVRGHYIIKGVKGEFYPCKPDVFELTYEEVNP